MTIQKFTRTVMSAMVLATMGVALSACTTTSQEKIDYRSTVKGSPLEVPPGMTDYAKNAQYDLSGVVSSKRVSAGQNAPVAGVPVLVESKDMYIERAGDTRWLVIKRPAEQVWPALQTFWEDNGFTLKVNQPSTGIMETDWAENRANLPQTGLRKIIGKALDSVYDTGLRDMFRTRVEKTASGTEVYISHRGMEEVYTSTNKDSTAWQPRKADAELESEMLRRLMVSLGTDDKSSKVVMQNAMNKIKGSEIRGNELIVNDSMDNAWRRVGLSLDRAGLSITDRNLSQRVYYVTPNPDDRGLFKKSFGKLKETYQVRFTSISANQTQVSFADRNGQPYTDDGLARVLKNLKDSLQ